VVGQARDRALVKEPVDQRQHRREAGTAAAFRPGVERFRAGDASRTARKVCRNVRTARMDSGM